MKLHLDLGTAQYRIIAYTHTEVQINDQKYQKSFIITPDLLIPDWEHPEFNQIKPEIFNKVMEFKPEIFILGSGKSFQLPVAEIRYAFYEKNIGFETMDSHAACRTFNILMAEDRKVAAAIILG